MSLSNPSDGQVSFKDSANLDAFGRLRISEPFEIFDFKPIANRGKTIWQERLTGAIMNISAVTGTPTVGDTVTGGTSGKTGTVTGVAGTVITYDTTDNDWTDTEALTFAGVGPGATATLNDHNTGADIVYNYNKSEIELSTGTVSGQRVIRQTSRYFPYVPGKSHNIDMTGVFETGKTGLKQRMMYGDDLNGIGFLLDGTIFKVVLRSSTTGTPVDSEVAQSAWNIDKMNGSGPSGITLDITKSQIQSFDFQWLGVGRVRMSLNIDGKNLEIHEFNHANKIDGVYMKTPTLPIRYEIENSGTPASTSTLSQICCSVSSQSGHTLPGFEFSAGLTFAQEVPVTTRRPIFAVRLKNNFPAGKPNRRQFKFLGMEIYARSSDCTFELVHEYDPISITGTWTDVDNASAIEFSTDVSAISATHSHQIQGPINLFSGKDNKGRASVISAEFISSHSYLAQNFESNNSELFVVYATSRKNTALTSCHISWIESD